MLIDDTCSEGQIMAHTQPQWTSIQWCLAFRLHWGWKILNYDQQGRFLKHINSSFHSLLLILLRVAGRLEPILAPIGQNAGYTLGGANTWRPFTPVSNLELPMNLTTLTACCWTVEGTSTQQGGIELRTFLQGNSANPCATMLLDFLACRWTFKSTFIALCSFTNELL